MSTITKSVRQVNPIRPFTAPSNFAEPFGTPRNLRGQFASTSDQELSIREVFFPRSWKFAYQVGGFGGAIFSDREAAVRFARARQAKLARVQATSTPGMAPATR